MAMFFDLNQRVTIKSDETSSANRIIIASIFCVQETWWFDQGKAVIVTMNMIIFVSGAGTDIKNIYIYICKVLPLGFSLSIHAPCSHHFYHVDRVPMISHHSPLFPIMFPCFPIVSHICWLHIFHNFPMCARIFPSLTIYFQEFLIVPIDF